jgi:hypothetical protein
MSKRITALFAALVVALSVTLTPASPAHAASGDCPNGRFCTWNNENYTGTRWEWNVGTIRALPNGCLNVTASANNSADSLYNRVGLINTVLRIHNNSNCTDAGVQIVTSQMDARLDWSPGIVSFGNLMTSISARAS